MSADDATRPPEGAVDPRIAALMKHGEETDCLELSVICEAVEAFELDDSQTEALFEHIK